MHGYRQKAKKLCKYIGTIATSKCFKLKRDIIIIGIVEKAKETSSDSGMHNRAIIIVGMCPGMQTHPHHTV